MRKTTTARYSPPSFNPTKDPAAGSEGVPHVPAHKDFRQKYFQGFSKTSEVDAPGGPGQPGNPGTE